MTKQYQKETSLCADLSSSTRKKMEEMIRRNIKERGGPRRKPSITQPPKH